MPNGQTLDYCSVASHHNLADVKPTHILKLLVIPAFNTLTLRIKNKMWKSCT